MATGSGSTDGNGRVATDGAEFVKEEASDDEVPKFSLSDGEQQYREKMPLDYPTEDSKDQELKVFSSEVELILLTINEHEYRAAAIKMKKPSDAFDRAVFVSGLGTTVVGMFAEKKTALIQSDVGENCEDYIAAAINAFPKAHLVIGVGVCYAFDSSKHRLGDVLVSKQICDFANLKTSKEGELEDRGETIDVAPKLQIFYGGLISDFRVTDARLSKVYSGRIASIAKLIDNEQEKTAIRKSITGLIGGEMEGRVLMKFYKKRKIEGAIIIKGVVDYADGRKKKDWQFTAAMAAVDYTHSKLKRIPTLCSTRVPSADSAAPSLSHCGDPEPVLSHVQQTKSGNNFQTPTDLDPSYEDLDQQFEENLTEIKKSYAKFVAELCKCITSKGVTVDEFRNFLLSMSAFEDEKDEQRCQLLSEVRDKLEKAESISNIFSFVYKWASFLNDAIFKSIMDHYDIPKDHESMKYSEHLCEYLRKHELSCFGRINPRQEELKSGKIEATTLTLKVDSEKLCRIAHVINLKRTVATILHMKVSALRLLDIREGCVEVTFLVPALTPDVLFGSGKTLTSRQVEQLQELSIEWMKCGEHEIDFRRSEVTGSSEKTSEEMEIVMIKAAKEDDVASIQRLLDLGIDPNVKEKDDYGWTPLMWACEKGNEEMVDCLLKRDATDVNMKDSLNWTGLMLSSRRGYLGIVRKLLDRGADVNIISDAGWNCLQWTAQEGHTEIAKLLIERGASTVHCDKAGFTPLLQASQDGKLGVVKLLVEHNCISGIALDKKTSAGWSAIMLASKNGHSDVVKYLADHGFDPHYRKQDGVTALHIASFKGYDEIVRYLCVDKMAEANLQDQDGITPLMHAVRRGELEVVKILVEKGGADVNISEKDWKWTALFYALEGVENRDLQVLQYLLGTGVVNLSHQDKNGNTVMNVAKTINPNALKYFPRDKKDEAVKVNRKLYEHILAANYRQLKDMEAELFTEAELLQRASESAGAA